MNLGFLTGCLKSTLEEKVKWAKENGFDALEISCWPRLNDRDYSGSDIDVEKLDDNEVEKIKSLFSGNEMKISSLAYYDNMLHHNLDIRNKYISHLKSVIDAAEKLGVELVGTFVGKDFTKTIEENFSEYEKVFRDLVDYCKSKKIKLMIENCPMPSWHKEGWGATISYSPELWYEMFKRIPDDNFGLNFDPSHLIWLQIDYIKALREFKDRIFHVHAKDCRLLKERVGYYSIFGKQIGKTHGEDLGFIKPCMPGLGDVEWDSVFEVLWDIGYTGAISIEHEDKDYEGTDDKVKEGLLIAYKYLREWI
ncbi:TIM barrel protein [Clostridium bovifaecis]|uniref:TIM barrel protein n=1 Tax=Clostridium bovifaecis TaxID=2184719 RepID=A0A6I6EWS3_9CLOT|nr:TIM barrel protein [Clostridium bovifaecis]